MEELQAGGVNKVPWNIEAGAEIKDITHAAAGHTQTDLDLRCAMCGSNSDVASCIAMNSPEIEHPFGFEEHFIENAAMVTFWSGNDAFDKKGAVRETPSPSY